MPLVWVFPFAEVERRRGTACGEGFRVTRSDARVVWLTSDRRSREHAVTITHGRSMRSEGEPVQEGSTQCWAEPWGEE